jgi:hypothetical protein
VSDSIDGLAIELMQSADDRSSGQGHHVGAAQSPWLMAEPPMDNFVIPNPVGDRSIRSTRCKEASAKDWRLHPESKTSIRSNSLTACAGY